MDMCVNCEVGNIVVVVVVAHYDDSDGVTVVCETTIIRSDYIVSPSASQPPHRNQPVSQTQNLQAQRAHT